MAGSPSADLTACCRLITFAQADAHNDPAPPLFESVWLEQYADEAIADGS